MSTLSQVMHPAFAFMGGTFDPIHNGHLRTALELQQWLGVQQLSLIPSQVPVHREAPGCSAQQRLEMVQLAVNNEPGLVVDDREIRSDKPSFSLNTLISLREELGATPPICMIMGMDAYLTLPSWHRWGEFLDLGHIIVVQRPGFELPEQHEMSTYTQEHAVMTPSELMQQPHGHVIMHELTPLGISATQVRTTIASGMSPRYLIPDAVWDYIKENRLYGEQGNK